MSWTSPRTWSSGRAVTAEVLNRSVRENLRVEPSSSHADVMAPTPPAETPSLKAVAVGVAAALVLDPKPLDRRGFFTPWRRK